jgi:hypothetical protein
MRAIVLAAVVTAFVLLPVGRGRAAQSNLLECGILIAPNVARRVIVTRNGALVTSLTIPRGMIICASYDEPPTLMSAGRWESFGDFVLRAQPASELPPAGMRRVEQMVRQALLVLTVQKSNVLIENVEP